MALYHFHVEQIKRSEGRTAVASALAAQALLTGFSKDPADILHSEEH